MTLGALEAVFGVITEDDMADELAARKTMLRVAVQAVRAGLAVVVDRPGEKIPLCPLGVREAKAADQAAVDQAYAEGRPRADKQRHPCGLHHAFTDPAEALAALTKLANRKATGRFNIGIEPRQSRLVVIDCDTPEQLAAFQHMSPSAALTVQSPGQVGDGDPDDVSTWAHHGGGHVWYWVPEGVELPTATGILKDESGWVAIWGEHQVLAPPSVRPEGPYRWLGGVRELPDWLRVRIEQAGTERAARIEESRRRREAAGPSSVDDWAAALGWSELLTADGWIETGQLDNCSCPVWTAPGPHGSPKSATAHEPGCSQYDCERGHGPLRVWTDNPSPAIAAAVDKYGQTLTLAQAAAEIEYGGQLAKLFREVDREANPLPPMPTTTLGLPTPEPAPAAPEPEVPGEQKPLAALPSRPATATSGTTTGDGEAELPTEGWAPAAAGPAEERFPNLPQDFWDRRPELAHIRQAAYARGVGADAALLAVLTRLASVVHHRSTVDLGIGPASLNLVGMLVGSSGVGKSMAMELAEDLLELPADLQMGGWNAGPVGTGEGLIELYWGTETIPNTDDQGKPAPGRPQKVRKQVRHNAYVFHDEAEGMFIAAGRRDATLMSVLRTMWSGGPVGQSNASHENTRRLAKRDYAWGALLGVQPEKAGPLFDDSTGGTPQRFLFAAVTDPCYPADNPPPHPGVLRPAGSLLRRGHDPAPVHLVVPDSIATEMRRDRALLVRGERVLGDELDAHRPLVLMKLSGLLAILAGRDEMTLEDWNMAELVWETSKAVRASTWDVVKGARAEEAHQRAEAEARLHVTKEAWATQEKVNRTGELLDRVAQKIGRKVWKDGEADRAAIKTAVNGRDVAAFDGTKGELVDAALSDAIAMGYVTEVAGPPRRWARGPVQPAE